MPWPLSESDEFDTYNNRTCQDLISLMNKIFDIVDFLHWVPYDHDHFPAYTIMKMVQNRDVLLLPLMQMYAII